MFKKHYISILIVVISFFGIASQKQVDIPNQEIVVQFDNANVASEEADSIIASIKNQLLELGIEEVTVSESNRGELKITYHSNSDVSRIKNKLTKDGSLKVDFNKKSQKNTNGTPTDNDIISYNLHVYEIQDNNTAWDFNGVNVSNITTKSDQLINPSTYLSTQTIKINNESVISEIYKVCTNSALSINEISHKIPEVRAGPVC